MKIMRAKALLLILVTGIFFTACQKEVSFQNLTPQPGGGSGGGSNNINITGDWNFVWSRAKTYVGISFSQNGQSFATATTSDYITENNMGTLSVTDKQFIFKGISHTVNDEATSETYIDGVLFSDVTLPFNASYPPTDETRDYVRNSNDSLTFTNVMAQVPDPNGGTTTAPTGPIGGKISVISDTLSVTINYAIKQAISQGGIPANSEIRVEGIMKFKKK